MESDVGTLLFVASLLGAGGLGLFYYGTEAANSSDSDSDNDGEKSGGSTNIKEDELEELDDSFFGSVTAPPILTSKSKKTHNSNNNSNNNNKSKKNGRKVRFNTKRRY